MAEERKIRTRLSRVLSFQRKSVLDDDEVEEDLAYTGRDKGLLPSNTSQWDLTCLHSLGIFYSDKPASVSDLLDIVYTNIGMFQPISEKQIPYTRFIQKTLDFSTSTQEVIDYSRKYKISRNEVDIDVAEKLKKNLKKDIFSKTNETMVRPYTVGLIEQFIRSAHHIVQMMRSKGVSSNVPERVFVNLFCEFVKLCDLNPTEGSLWRANQSLLQHNVSSEVDVVILPSDMMDASDYKAVTVVSIVEVKKMSSSQKVETADGLSVLTRSSSSSESSEPTVIDKDSSSKPSIYKRVSKKVLGQHGAELIVHHEIFGEKCVKNGKIYLSGMIVVGTQVIFTLLVCSVDHMVDILHKKVVGKERSYICYSEPKDLLNKKDRDELLEAFGRLNNISS